MTNKTSFAKKIDLRFSNLEKKLIGLANKKDNISARHKRNYYNEVLLPIVEDLTPNSPLSTPEEQLPFLKGIWQPLWTTMPFQDMIPGRSREQSYQIFNHSNYYANVARYYPMSKSKFIRQIFSPTYDLMIIQKFHVENSQWIIENIGIKQVIRKHDLFSLTPQKAQSWFETVISSELKAMNSDEVLSFEKTSLDEFNRKWHKKLQTTYKAQPFFEHLYMSQNLRIVKTRREANQRHSYTIAVRYQ
ncbi:MAG: hypothetical protein QNJ47_17950 [Nostocaceae cyanobacterium]|nr:hypothetical protein [Nostocaceae cyanobacterium]